MSVTGLRHYNLRAERPMLDRLRDFYVTMLGLELGYRPPFRRFGYWLYAGGRDIVHLSEAGTDEHRPAGVVSTFDHVAFACTNASEFRQRLDARGIEYRCEDVPLTGELQIFFKDPAGNGVELTFPSDQL